MVSRSASLEKWRFGPFEFDGATGELRKNGIRIRLQTKPAQMLAALLNSAGQVVTREELRQLLWPADTFVDFESGLNTAVKRLRDALNDSADQPRYIETLPRNGYRFAGEAEILTATLSAVPVAAPQAKEPSAGKPRAWITVGAAVLGLAAGVVPWLWTRSRSQSPPEFRQVTFQRSPVAGARFGPDGQTILYSALIAGRRRLFLNNGVSPESRALEGRSGSVAAVSRKGELALLEPSGTTPLAGSVLWQAPMNGGEAREVDRSVMAADWSETGELAVAKAASGSYQLEYPRGKVLFRTSGWLSEVRVSRDGGPVAFLHHPVRHDDGGSLTVVDAGGNAQVLVKDWAVVSGLAWHPEKNEIWFSGSKTGGAGSLWAVDMRGNVRAVYSAPGSLALEDIGAGGRVLLTRQSRRLEMAIGGDGIALSEITWHDWSRIQEISADGSLILFEESGDGTSGRPVTFLYRTAAGTAVRVAEGRAMGLAPGGEQVLLLDPADRKRLLLAPLASGTPRPLPSGDLEYQWARFLPDGNSLLALANKHGEPLRLYRVRLSDSKADPVTPPTVVRNAAISPDGRHVAVLNAERQLAVYPFEGGGEPRIVPVSEPMAPLLWQDGFLMAQRAAAYTEVPARVYEVDPRTGATRLWRELGPTDPTGVNAVTRVVLSQDRKRWAFNYRRVQSELFVALGLR